MPKNELVIQNVNAVLKAQHRLESHLWVGQGRPTVEADKLILFTFEEQAKDDSRNNLRICLDYAEQLGSEYFVVTEYKMQWVGQKSSALLNQLINKKLNDEFQQLEKTKSKLEIEREKVNAECATVRRYGLNLFMKPERGVYHVATRQRIKTRHKIIEEFWRFGFATRRGRIPSVGDLRWSGPRTHIEHITALAKVYQNDPVRSAISRKICSAKNSINRDYAWPGHW